MAIGKLDPEWQKKIKIYKGNGGICFSSSQKEEYDKTTST
jgi:hypothetical protein